MVVMSLRQIAYVSVATAPLAPEEVRDLVSCARRNNVRDNVTGLLLVGRCGFVQVLEGPPSAMVRLFERLEDDPRHYGMVRLHEADVALRAFAECPLALRQADADSMRRLEAAMPQLGAGLCSTVTTDAVGLAW